MSQVVEGYPPWVVMAIGGGILVYLFILLMRTQIFRSFLGFVAMLLAAGIIVGALLFLPLGVYFLVRLLIFQTELASVTVKNAVIMTAASSIVLLVSGTTEWLHQKGWLLVAKNYLRTLYQHSTQGR